MDEAIFVKIIILIAGFLAGFLVCKGLYMQNEIGTLRIDHSDPDESPYLFLEITNARKIMDGKTVTLRVKEEDYISQK